MRQILDAHLHVWERAKHPQPWIDPDTMAGIAKDFPPTHAVAELGRHGVRGGVVVQAVNDIDETVDLLADSRELDAVAGVVGWVDLTGDVRAQVGALRSGPGGEKLVGIRHVTFVEDDERWLSRDDVGRGLDDLADLDLTFDVLVGHEQLAQAAQVVRDHPRTRFVLDHLGKVPVPSTTLVDWARDLALVAGEPNVVAKVSGLVTEDEPGRWSVARLRPIVDHALRVFGPRRLLFGSDWPLAELAGGYEAWLRAYVELTDRLAPDDQAAIDGRNTARTYGLTR
ncbi:amidohydrolase [Isoptericola sp. BMS4]|uniref:amidohydrolase family protein n=1 Tax=Isoptericola sp. BMS4 TaxID=2527875 RepID=UPI00141F2DDE|nr:amidohydrolase family protein [Isoptericola sp. BMS4]